MLTNRLTVGLYFSIDYWCLQTFAVFRPIDNESAHFIVTATRPNNAHIGNWRVRDPCLRTIQNVRFRFAIEFGFCLHAAGIAAMIWFGQTETADPFSFGCEPFLFFNLISKTRRRLDTYPFVVNIYFFDYLFRNRQWRPSTMNSARSPLICRPNRRVPLRDLSNRRQRLKCQRSHSLLSCIQVRPSHPIPS